MSTVSMSPSMQIINKVTPNHIASSCVNGVDLELHIKTRNGVKRLTTKVTKIEHEDGSGNKFNWEGVTKNKVYVVHGFMTTSGTHKVKVKQV